MILTATGQPLTREQLLAEADARTFRAYKKILEKYGYAESLWCRTCDEDADHAGCRAQVLTRSIAIECRHRRVYYTGSTL